MASMRFGLHLRIRELPMRLIPVPIVWLLVMSTACQPTVKKDYLKYVNPLIGTAPFLAENPAEQKGDRTAFGQTIPAVTAPFGMTQWTPQTRHTEEKCVAPFYFLDPQIEGFRATHWTSGSCVQDYGSFTIAPLSGTATLLPHQRKAAYFIDHDKLSPAYCAVHTPAYDVITEITSTKRCGFFRFSWLLPTDPVIVIDVNSDEGQGSVQIFPERNEIVASNPVHRIYNGHGEKAGFSGHIVIRFDTGFESFGTYAGGDYTNGSTTVSGLPGIGAFVRLQLKKDQVTMVRIGTSFTSIDQARKNLEAEIPDWDFDATRKSLEDTWNQLLGRIDVSGGTEDEKKTFYTALYHSCLHPRLFSDADGTFTGFGGDTAVHRAEGYDYYTDFSAWDTHRAQMPLLSLIAPAAYKDMVTSLITMAEQGGWLPIFPMWNSYTSAMIGDHCTAIIGDAIMKDFDVDAEKAWTYIRKNAFETPEDPVDYADGKGRRSLDSYLQLGYIPLEDVVPYAFHREEQVSRTLEYAYDDWVAAQVARKLGKENDHVELSHRALNYLNVFNPDTGWVVGRYTDGNFTGDYDLDRGEPWITEGTPRHYSWVVPHDIPGLIDVMGGEEEFRERLRDFFDRKAYWHGNEPGHHIPYLFNYTGDWAMTQETVRKILESEYFADPGGLSGNDDAGQMSAWYVFSAMGFYPVCPGSNAYQLAAPLFEKIALNLEKPFYPGKTLIIEGMKTNRNDVFRSVTLNGQPVQPFITHDQIKQGGTLDFLTGE